MKFIKDMADNKHGSEEWDAPPPNVGGNGMEEEPLSQERKSMRAFLAGLGGRIATSRYDDAFIAAGFDNVEMLNVDPAYLADSCPSVLRGHAMQIAKAAQAAVGNTIESLDVEKMRLAGEIPRLQVSPGASQQSTIDMLVLWLASVVSWCRVWHPMMAVASQKIIDDPDANTSARMQDRWRIDHASNTYMGDKMLVAMHGCKYLVDLMSEQVKVNPRGLDLVELIARQFLRKTASRIAKVRKAFINVSPTLHVKNLKHDLVEWKNKRQFMIAHRDPMSDMACKASLMQMIDKLDIRRTIEDKEIMEQVTISLEDLIAMLDRLADNHVPLSCDPNPTHKSPKGNPKSDPKGENRAATKVQSINASSSEVDMDKACHNWVVKGRQCRCEKGKESGAQGACAHYHYPDLENSNHPHVMAKMAETPCSRGKDCYWHGMGKCHYKHD